MERLAEVPDSHQAAYDLVSDDPGVKIVRAIEARPSGGGSQFAISLPVPTPNPEGLPAEVTLRVELPATYPLSLVDFYAESDEVRGFPHQDAETGKLCLREQNRAPWDVTRIQTYIQWAREWLADAANGCLLSPGDPYELPDFSRRELRIPLDKSLMFVEDSESYGVWRDRIGETGTVDLRYGLGVQGIFAARFTHPSDGTILAPPFSCDLLKGKSITGTWILVGDLRYRRHRPAQTFSELKELCRRFGVDLQEELHKAWKLDNRDPELAVVLLGAPIPRDVEDPPSEVHWQPLVIRNQRADHARHKPRRGRIKPLRLWGLVASEFTGDRAVPWGRAVNVAPARLKARGSLCDELQRSKVAVVGCGALGCVVAELLARGGVRNLALFDPDSFELGNQARHTLEGFHVGLNKAHCLANRLASTNPISVIRGFPIRVPISIPPVDEEREGLKALESADVVVDCTTDDAASIWLSEFAKKRRIRLVTMFFDFHAEVLTICVSGKQIGCWKVQKRLYESIARNETPVLADDYFREPGEDERVLPGAGCWQATFPALGAHVWMLGSAGVDILNNVMKLPLGCDGHGILAKRSAPDLNVEQSGTLLEILWLRKYR